LTQKISIGLVEHARQWIGQSYWYGTCCYDCTAGLLSRKKEQYPSHYQESRMVGYRNDIAKGRRCADCVGLIKGYIWDQNGRRVYDKSTDVNTTGLFNRATVKGLIETMPEAPGLIAYKAGHVGIYEGGGNVIEAKGFVYGIVRSRLSDTKWTHWLECPFIAYDCEQIAVPEKPVEPALYRAKVVNVKVGLNLRTAPKNAENTIRLLKPETVVEVLEDHCGNGFSKVRHGDTAGYCTSAYLHELKTEDTGEEHII